LVGLPAVLEAVAVPVHLQDVDMVGETIEEGSGKPFRSTARAGSLAALCGFSLPGCISYEWLI